MKRKRIDVSYFINMSIAVLVMMVLVGCSGSTETPTEAPPPEPIDTAVPEPTDTTVPEPTAAPTETATPVAEMMTPSVTVTDQAIEAGAVTVPEVVSEGPGWIVIHRDQDGAPGPAIGHTAVSVGTNNGVTVEIDTSAATETLYAMLHVDEGVEGTYEFPDGDPPVQVDDKIVVRPFAITGGMETGSMVQEEDVSAVEFAFEPAELAVPVGTTVVWTNVGSQSHTVTADDGTFESGTLDSGETFAYTFTEAGTFPYHCSFHGDVGGEGMAGTIIVTEG